MSATATVVLLASAMIVFVAMGAAMTYEERRETYVYWLSTGIALFGVLVAFVAGRMSV